MSTVKIPTFMYLMCSRAVLKLTQVLLLQRGYEYMRHLRGRCFLSPFSLFVEHIALGNCQYPLLSKAQLYWFLRSAVSVLLCYILMSAGIQESSIELRAMCLKGSPRPSPSRAPSYNSRMSAITNDFVVILHIPRLARVVKVVGYFGFAAERTERRVDCLH